MKFEAKTVTVLKHILYTLFCEHSILGPQNMSRRETEFWHLNQFTEQHVSLHTYALENLPHVS